MRPPSASGEPALEPLGAGPAAHPLTILHVAAPAPYGGLEGVLQALALGQLRRGHTVHVLAVLTPGAGAHPFVQALERAGVPVTGLRVPRRGYRRERAAVLALARELDADVLHTHGYRPDVVDGPVAARLGIPRVSTVHGFTGGGWRNRLYERLQRRALRRFDGVVAVSSALARELAAVGVPWERLHLLPNAPAPTDLPLDRAAARARLGLPDDIVALGWVGRISREKGLDVAVAALPALSDLPVRLCALGGGEERAAVLALAARLGVAERVLWLGEVPDAARLLRAFDVFVLSSRTEGTPLVLFEAIAAGVPVVAAAVGGVPLVVSAEEALLVPGDAPAALAGAIRACLADPPAAAARAAAATARLRREFGFDPWLEGYERVYEGVLRGR